MTDKKRSPLVIPYEQDVRCAFGETEIMADDSAVFIRELAVSDNSRRDGVGSKLVQKAIAQTKNRDIYTCAIEDSGSVELFEKLGFFKISLIAPIFYNLKGQVVMGRLSK